MSEHRPFVPRGVPVDDRRPPTPEELAEMRAIVRASGRPVPRTPKPQTLTDTESAAIARKKLDDQQGRKP